MKDTIDLGYGVVFVLCAGCSERDEMDVFHLAPSTCSGTRKNEEGA